MILKRLYELAERKKLLADPAFDPSPVACAINIGKDGRFLGIKDLRNQKTIPPKSKNGQAKTVLDKGMLIPLPPRPILIDPESKLGWKLSDAAVNGKEKPAVFLADTLSRVLPLKRLIPAKDAAKCDAQRSTFYRFLAYAARETGDAALLTIEKFRQWVEESEANSNRVCDEVEAKGLSLADVCTFAYEPDAGPTVIDREPVRQWWREFYQNAQQAQQEDSIQGLCQVTEKSAPLAASVKTRVSGLISIGCRAEAYLVTSLGAATSYGLGGAANGMVSDQGIDGFTRALNALIANTLDVAVKSSIRIGGTMFLYWTQEESDEVSLEVLDAPKPEQVTRLLTSIESGQRADALSENAFYCLTLSGNSARIVVRDYLEAPVGRVKRNLGRWFSDLRIVDPNHQEITAVFPLFMLVGATVRELSDAQPALTARFVNSAIKNEPLPESVLAACVRRLHAEGDQGFRPSRLALIKLVLNRLSRERQGELMSDSLDPAREAPAYVCGRLLAVFERIQFFSLGDVNASVVDRFYGTASTAPALVFPRFFKSSEQHLAKLYGEKTGLAVNLQKELESISLGLRGPKKFPSLLSLTEQGEFALGFYHQRASYRMKKVNENE